MTDQDLRLYSVRAQHALTRLEYLGSKLELGSDNWSKAVADWYITHADIHHEGTHLLCHLIDASSALNSVPPPTPPVSAYYHQNRKKSKKKPSKLMMPYKEHIHLHHEGAATIAAGIINAMHRIVIVSRPTTLHQISESIQTLVVCAAGNLDSLAVMETIRMIVKWHDLRPNIFTWNFMKETHELMQSRLLGSFRWLHEREPGDLDYLDYLWPNFMVEEDACQHLNQFLNESHLNETKRNVPKTKSKTFTPKTLYQHHQNMKSTKVLSPKMRRRKRAKSLVVDAAAALNAAQQKVQAKSFQQLQQQKNEKEKGKAQNFKYLYPLGQFKKKTKKKTNEKQDFIANISNFTGVQNHVNALEQMIRDLLASQKIQRRAAEAALHEKDVKISALERKCNGLVKKDKERRTEMIKLKASRRDLVKANETLIDLMREYKSTEMERKLRVVEMSLGSRKGGGDGGGDGVNDENEWEKEVQNIGEDVWNVGGSFTKANIYRLLASEGDVGLK